MQKIVTLPMRVNVDFKKEVILPIRVKIQKFLPYCSATSQSYNASSKSVQEGEWKMQDKAAFPADLRDTAETLN